MDSTNREQTDILRNIHTELRELNGRVERVTDRMEDSNHRLDTLREHTSRGFADLDERLGVTLTDALAAVAQEIGKVLPRMDELDRRLTRLEDHLGLRRRG